MSPVPCPRSKNILFTFIFGKDKSEWHWVGWLIYRDILDIASGTTFIEVSLNPNRSKTEFFYVKRGIDRTDQLNQKLNEKSQCSNTLHKSRIKSDCEYLMVPNHEPEGSLRPFQTIRQSIRGRLTTSAIESSWSAYWNSCPEKLSSKSRHGNKRISDIRLMQWMDSSTSNYNWKIIWWRLPVG